MDDRRFDRLARALGHMTTRRQAIRGLFGLVAGSTVGLVAHDTRAARRGYDGPPEASGQGMTVVIAGARSGDPGQCRIVGTVSNAQPTIPVTFRFTSVDGTFAERRIGFTDASGSATGRTQGTVPSGTVATCAVTAGAWQTGSDPTVITC